MSKALAAIAQATATFADDQWTTIDLGSVGPNMTDVQPGADVESIMIENKFTSTGSAFVVFKNDPGAGAPATDGWEVEPGAVYGEDAVRNMRYVSLRSIGGGAGTVKIMLRSFKTALQAPWGD
tara:strand:- start:5718 stop:6086 length:369 start_codon:yes stop_codon:yes gene_type:complete